MPPELPPEYAEAYRRGYESAVQQASGSGLDEPDEPGDEPGVTRDFRPLFADELGSDGRAAIRGRARAEPERPLLGEELFDEDGDARRRGSDRPGWSLRCWPASWSCSSSAPTASAGWSPGTSPAPTSSRPSRTAW